VLGSPVACLAPSPTARRTDRLMKGLVSIDKRINSITHVPRVLIDRNPANAM
jgi:hypothetical protein